MILSIFCLATTESLTNQTQTRLIHQRISEVQQKNGKALQTR